MKTFRLAIAAVALSVAGIVPAFAGSSDHFDQADYLAIARGQPHATETVVEGRQAVAVPTTGSTGVYVDLATARDAGSKR